MPVHDWTRVISGIFHDFHQRWAVEISAELNSGLLPEGFYSMTEQIAEGPRPDVITLEVEDRAWESARAALGETALAVADRPPRVRYTEELESEIYAHSANRVAVYHASGDRVVAYIEIVSPGNKHSDYEVREFIDRLDEALFRGCHLLVIDVLPPGRHDPRGMHAAFWEHRGGHGHPVTANQPLGLAAYRVRRVGDTTTVPRVWFETVGIGEPLPNMPLFLTPDHYVEVPLEQTYLAAWKGVPQRWKRVIEGTDTPAQPSSTTDNGPRTTDKA